MEDEKFEKDWKIYLIKKLDNLEYKTIRIR